MRRIYALLFCAIVALPMMADDYAYLNIATSSGSETSLSVSNLEIVYSDGKLVATNDDGTQSFTLTDLTKMYFSTTTGISSVNATEESPITVYSVSGALVGTFKNADEARQNLTPGVYLFKSQSKTVKTVIP
ncbi:MAG: hypothetical protein ACOYJG_09835 [Prevotella sp.]|jgi:hypothetical protein